MLKHLAAIATATALAPQAFAEPMSLSGLDESQWRHDLTVYAFLPASTSGTSTVAGSAVDLDLDLSDALDLLNGAIAGRYEGWNGNFGIIADLNFVDLEAGGTLSGPPLTVNADITQSWLALLAAFRVSDTTYGTNGQRFAFDVQGGLRYNKLKQEITASPALPPFPLGGTEEWWEPVIGARAMWQINEEWAAILEADVGGFGAGGSDLQYGVNAVIDWRPWANTSLKFGWRFYGLDFATDRSDGAFGYDVSQNGPYLGVTFRFQ